MYVLIRSVGMHSQAEQRISRTEMNNEATKQSTCVGNENFYKRITFRRSAGLLPIQYLGLRDFYEYILSQIKEFL